MDVTGKRGKISRRVRLEDLAERCGVSVSTVSRALSTGQGVRPEIRAEIIEAARTYNYAMPSSVAGKKAMIVASSAAMIDYGRNQFTLHVLEGLQERATTLRMEILTRSIANPAEERQLLDEAMKDEAIAGLLFLTLDDEDMLAPTRDFKKPIVLVNGDDPFMRLSSVTPCNRSAAALATDHLRQLGHERILFLMRPGRRTIERRYEGWHDRMRLGGAVDPRLVVKVEDWLPELARAAILKRLDEKGRDFTAVLAAGDALAVGAMVALSERDIRVPDDVSVVGMDGLPQGAFHNPPLTRSTSPCVHWGAALDLLRETVTGFEMPARRVELACRMVERASTGPAPAA